MNKSKRKGSKWEKDVADYMTSRGLPVVRQVTAGKLDRGDLWGLVNWVLECKATRELDLAAARREATIEATNAGTDYFASIHKKRQANTKDAYVEIPLWMFCDLLLAITGRADGA